MTDDSQTLPDASGPGNEIGEAGSGAPHKVKVASRRATMAQWQGPLPPPSVVAAYDQVIPDGADRVMKMAERALDAEIADRRRGPVLGAAVSIAAMGFALASVPLGASWQLSAAFISVPIFAAVKALIESGGRSPDQK